MLWRTPAAAARGATANAVARWGSVRTGVTSLLLQGRCCRAAALILLPGGTNCNAIYQQLLQEVCP